MFLLHDQRGDAERARKSVHHPPLFHGLFPRLSPFSLVAKTKEDEEDEEDEEDGGDDDRGRRAYERA